MARKPKCNNCKAFCPTSPSCFIPASCDLGYKVERVKTIYTALGEYDIYGPKDGKCKKPKNNEEYNSLLKDKQMGIL